MTDARVLCWVWSDRISNLETQIRIDNIQEICVKGELKDKSSNVEGLLLQLGCFDIYPFENKNIDPGYNNTKIISILEWVEEIQSKLQTLQNHSDFAHIIEKWIYLSTIWELATY